MKIIHSTIQNKLSSIASMEAYKECLMLRLHLMKSQYAYKSEYEKNEIDIVRFGTTSNINGVQEVLEQKKRELEEDINMYIEELEFAEKNIE